MAVESLWKGGVRDVLIVIIVFAGRLIARKFVCDRKTKKHTKELCKMTQHICSNPDCRKIYNLDDREADDGFCGYDCFEKVNCLFPEIVKFEEFSLEGL